MFKAGAGLFMVHHVVALRQSGFVNDSFGAVSGGFWRFASGSDDQLEMTFRYCFLYAFAGVIRNSLKGSPGGVGERRVCLMKGPDSGKTNT